MSYADCRCDKHHDKEQFGEEGISPSYGLQSILEGSQGRSLKQKAWGNVTYQPAFSSHAQPAFL